MDHADYLGLHAPRPTLILASTRDFFDIQGTWTTFREAKQLYGLLGHPERVDIIEENATHGYNKAHREAMLRWMRRWLLGKDDAPTEGELAVETDADLQCTGTGQVLSDLRGKSVFDLNAERAIELARERKPGRAGRDKAGLLADVRRLIALPGTIVPARREGRGEFERDGRTVRKLVFTTAPGIEVPALLIMSAKDAGKARLDVLVGYDRSGAIGPGSLAEDRLKLGNHVLIPDLRGTGRDGPDRQEDGPVRPRRRGIVFLAPPGAPPCWASGSATCSRCSPPWTTCRPIMPSSDSGRPGRSPCTRRCSIPGSPA